MKKADASAATLVQKLNERLGTSTTQSVANSQARRVTRTLWTSAICDRVVFVDYGTFHYAKSPLILFEATLSRASTGLPPLDLDAAGMALR